MCFRPHPVSVCACLSLCVLRFLAFWPCLPGIVRTMLRAVVVESSPFTTPPATSVETSVRVIASREREGEAIERGRERRGQQ
eukprot:348966-Rhodomonas_salina.2